MLLLAGQGHPAARYPIFSRPDRAVDHALASLGRHRPCRLWERNGSGDAPPATVRRGQGP